MADTPEKDYVVVNQPFRTEYVIEKSRFITSIAPCQTEEEAQAFISRIKKEFWDARHNCSAFAIGPRQEQQRSSDDGEPSGTAGKPILEVLKKTQITNTAIVVTRYFGGIKLGAGGLIRAYSHSAALGVQGASKEVHTQRELLDATIDYSAFGSVERYLQEHQYTYQTAFTDAVSLAIYAAPDQVEGLRETIANLTGGQAIIQSQGLKEVALPIDL